MNSENSKTSDHHRLLLNLSDKIELKRSNKYIKKQISEAKTNIYFFIQQDLS